MCVMVSQRLILAVGGVCGGRGDAPTRAEDFVGLAESVLGFYACLLVVGDLVGR